MATSWTLVVAAPLAQVAASVEPLASKPALSALGDDATVARFECDAVNPGALAFELRGLLGAVVDAVPADGIRALDSLDGVDDLAAARKAPGTYVAAPKVMSFADVAAAFGAPAPADATAIKNVDDLSAKLTSAFKSREDPATLEKRLRASRGMAEWGAVFGVAAEPGAAGEKDAADAPIDKDALRAALKESAEGEAGADVAIPEAADDTTLQKSEGRRALEAMLRGEGEKHAEGEAGEGGSAPAEGAVGKP